MNLKDASNAGHLFVGALWLVCQALYQFEGRQDTSTPTLVGRRYILTSSSKVWPRTEVEDIGFAITPIWEGEERSVCTVSPSLLWVS